MDWLDKLPRWVKLAFILGGFLLSVFSGRLHESWQNVGLWLGIIIIIIGLVAVLGHFASGALAARSRRVRGRSVRRPRGSKLPVSQVWPIIGMAASGVIFVLCVAWLLFNNHTANVELHKMLQRYVLPRHLTEQQIATTGAYLKQYQPHRFNMTVLKESSEASQYAQDIRRAMELGGWEVVGFNYTHDVREGITYYRRHPLQEDQSSEAQRNRPDRLFQEALAAAKIQIAGGGSGGSAEPMPEVAFTIIVGPRSMSDADLLALEEERQRALKLIHDETD